MAENDLGAINPNTIDAIFRRLFQHIQAQQNERKLYTPDKYVRYREDTVRFGVEILGETFTPDIVRVMESVRDNQVTIARSGNGTGKCLERDELIHLADGSRIAAGELVGRSFQVHSVDERLNVRVSTAYATDNGVEPVVRVTTTTGRSIVRTLNHPLLSADSHFDPGRTPRIGRPHWTEAGSLQVGDVVMTVSVAPADGHRSVDAHEIRILDHPIGDGAPSGHLPVPFVWEQVVSVELLPPAPTVAITVPGDETFLTDFVEHNTHAAARIAVWWYLCFHRVQVYTTAAPPASNLRNLLWGEIGTLVAAHPELFQSSIVTDMMIKRAEQEFITGVLVPSSGLASERQARFSGKHAPNLLFIVDEGDAVPDPVYDGIESCMSGGHTRLLVTFNPRDRTGPIYRKERENQANVVELSALNHPNVVKGENYLSRRRGPGDDRAPHQRVDAPATGDRGGGRPELRTPRLSGRRGRL